MEKLDQILDMSIKELKDSMDKKEISSEDIAVAYKEQIEKTDKKIGSYLYINENIVKEAREIDKKRLKGEDTGILCGIPVGIKDNMCTIDMPTTCASKMMDGYMSPFDATIVKLSLIHI